MSPSTPTPRGVIYSAATIDRLAKMKPAAPDFMLMWDNAYCIHEFDCDYVAFPDIISLCAKYGNADMVYEFASTSKVTFPGAGVGVMASSADNIAYFSKLINIQTIGFDKINQLRHVLFLKDKAHTLTLMKQHAAIPTSNSTRCWTLWTRRSPCWASPATSAPLAATLSAWTSCPAAPSAPWPVQGGRRHHDRCRCHLPLRQDPQDSNIRIAPPCRRWRELEQAVAVFCTCLSWPPWKSWACELQNLPPPT